MCLSVFVAKFLNPLIFILQFHSSDVQHHSNLVTLEVFRAATAFAPNFGRQFIPALPFESEILEKILRQGEGE